MRLRSLTLAAIGPFAGEYTIDFDALGAGGLFLLEGPTGAGKSTIIDAIVFALYGKVASAEASEDRLRSAYASDTTESVVDLTFEVAAGTFRVRRTPAYERAKLRGTGTVRQQASVKLWRVSPDGLAQVVATRLDEAGLELQRVVGLDRAQFVQTIVLPQGEFARFLRADPEDRRGLLQRIFGTEVYERIGRRLVELRREAEHGVAAARAALAGTLSQVVGAARLADDEAAGVTSLVDASSAELGRELSERVAALDGSARQAEQVAVAAVAAHDAARAALDEAVELDRRVRLRDRLRTEAEALVARAAAVEADRASLVTARAAADVRPFVAKADEAGVAAGAAHKALDAAADAAPGDLRDLMPDAAALRVRRDEAVREVAAIERWVRVEAGLVDARHALRRARDGIEDLHAELRAHDDWLGGREDARAMLSTRLATARATAADAGTQEAAVERLDALALRVADLAAARAELAGAEAAVPPLAAEAGAAVEIEAGLRRARIAGLAGELAADLQPGEECPVCGAVEHPHRAVLGADHVSQERVDEAREVGRRAEAALGEATAEVARAAERVAGLARLVGDETAESVEARLVAAREALGLARAAQHEADALESSLTAFDGETAARRTAREDVALRLAADEVRAEALAQQLDADEAGVAAAAGQAPTVAARHAALVELAASADGLVAALAAAQAADARHASRAADLAEALSARGFGDAEAAREAWLEPAAVTRLERDVMGFDESVAANRAALAAPEVADLPTHARVDVDASRAAEQHRRAEADRAGNAAGLLRDRADAVARAVSAAVGAADTLEAARRSAAPVARLAGLASGTGGDNAHDLTLATYVLQRRFDDVVAAANDRLTGMSDGRYELVRSDTKEDVSSRRRGLAMQVADHRTGQRRDPRTLSGGETFYVSLCLALGMADVVTAEAGGIELGTLFVDEGFGSLDPETLDKVLGVLDRLRAGGRVVGVVSHVEALKQAIADRIEVRHLPDGSSRLAVRAA